MAAWNVGQLSISYQNKIYQEPNSGCWIWLGSVNHNGYGRKRVKGTQTGIVRTVHRDVYEQLVGPIPPGIVLDHKCRVRPCCNPYHLEPVTTQENTRRGERNQYTLKTHCPEGHPYSGDNLVLYMKGGRGPYRQCRSCKKAQLKRYHRRNGSVRIGEMEISLIDREYALGRTYLKGQLAIKI